jgi:hypothetical protein
MELKDLHFPTFRVSGIEYRNAMEVRELIAARQEFEIGAWTWPQVARQDQWGHYTCRRADVTYEGDTVIVGSTRIPMRPNLCIALEMQTRKPFGFDLVAYTIQPDPLNPSTGLLVDLRAITSEACWTQCVICGNPH